MKLVKSKKKNLFKMRFEVPPTRVIVSRKKRKPKYKKRKNDYLNEINKGKEEK